MVIASTSSLGYFFHYSNASPFGQTISSTSTSNSSGHHVSIPFSFGSPAAFGGSAFPGNQSSPFQSTSSGKQCRGSGVASYSATPVVDGKIRSISAMQVYQSKSHEELRSEDYELCKGFTFPVQNQGNAFQQLKSPFDLRTRPVPSSQSMFGSLSGTSTAAFGPLSSFRFAEGDVGREASNVSAFKVSNTPGFGILSTPSSWSTSASSNSSIFGIQTSSGFQATTNECTVSKQCQGSGVASYSSMRDNRYSVESLQSMSAMPIYKDKSHEELRWAHWENYQLCNKGGQKPQGGRFLSSLTSPNIFHPAPFEHFRPNISGPKIGNIITPNSTLSLSVNPFPPTNLGPSSQTFIPQHTAVFPMPTSNPFRPFNPSVLNIGNCTAPNNTTSTAQTLSPSVNPFSPTTLYPSQSLASISQTNAVTSNPFQPSNSTLSVSKIGNYNAPNNTISTATTLFPSVNTFSPTTLYPSQSQASIPQPTAVSSMPAFNPFSESMPANSNQFPKISMTLPSPSFIGPSKPTESVTLSPSIQSTSALASWPLTPNASKLGQTSDKVDIPTNDRNQPSQAPNGSTAMMQVGSKNINGQQHVTSSTLGMQSSLVMNPFAMESLIDQSKAAKTRLHGISSIPVSNNLSPNRRSSLLRIRHVSFRHHPLPAQSLIYGSSETKVPFFNDEVDAPGPIAPFLPRENPRAWVKNSLSLHSCSNDKGQEIEDNKNSMGLTDDSSIREEDLSATLISHQDHVDLVAEKHEADVLAILPKLTNGEYYTEPSLKELAANEMAEPGWCSRVNDFVVGRRGYGSIKFLGDTDVRLLDLESIVQFIGREVIIYPDDRKKPPIGQRLNKRSEVTLVNIKCISKKTGKQYVEGPQVHGYKEMLIKKISEQGAEFVSYDPVQGELKFRVQHF